MIIHLNNNLLTRYLNYNGYATSENILLEGNLADITQLLLIWLKQQIKNDETIFDIVIEETTKVAIAYENSIDAEGNEIQIPTNFRQVLSAAVSVTSPLGARTFVISSENLPNELRDALLNAWASF